MILNSTHIRIIFEDFYQSIHKNCDYLIELDSVAGDGDLGIAMDDGFKAINEMILNNDENDIGKLLFAISKTINKAAASSAGTLLSSAFMTSAKVLKGKEEIDETGLVLMIENWLDGIVKMGGAKVGEKTLVDALSPAVEAMKNYSGTDMKAIIAEGVNAARQGAEDAKELKAVHGKMAVKGEKSKGMWDPGTILICILLQSMADSIEKF